MDNHHDLNYYLDSRKLMEKQLINKLKQSLPPSVKLIAYNYSHAGTSLYALLQRKQQAKTLEWLTLRLADHPLWLENAQQLFINFGNPADLGSLAKKLTVLFENPKVEDYFYKLTPSEIAILQFLDACQKQGMIWAVRLPEKIFAARKQITLDLKNDFIETDLFLGNRNNLNTMLLPVEAKEYQAELAVLFGRNLLFSKFARSRLLRLLPTNQWIQPVIKSGITKGKDWKEQIANVYGQELLNVYKKGEKLSMNL
ncbi:hypothetical protein SAMN02745249_00995 [Atopostipes suicloacalis DSM 15692]|uniref:Uncharacterized protein n=1 Tax=Atopostipes suicloacalis DSM 15692 TaxID=1121025 RepID=A0A1M4VQQ5_9LACT|nr:hypothetical protein [Atopostipes suicloacalis]SHE71356.1 hypothetical protein SAMN02745249_00995 [Atopostipes suicloacalis DSM 15692]